MNIYKLGWSCINQKRMKFWLPIHTELRSISNSLKFFFRFGEKFWNHFHFPFFPIFNSPRNRPVAFKVWKLTSVRSILLVSNRSLIDLTRPRIPWERNVDRRHDSTRLLTNQWWQLWTNCLHRVASLQYRVSFVVHRLLFCIAAGNEPRNTIIPIAEQIPISQWNFPKKWETLCFYRWENRKGLKRKDCHTIFEN